MYVIRFTPTRIVPFSDRGAFENRILRWLALREAENVYFFGILGDFQRYPPDHLHHMFTLEEDNTLLAAGCRHPNGTLCMTWATHEWAERIADHALENRWNINTIWAPGHTAWLVGSALGRRTQATVEIQRSERVYQLAANMYQLPSGGRLDLATSADLPLVQKWASAFVDEAQFELSQPLEKLVESLVQTRQLFLWKNPEPVAMASWVAPTPNGGCINFVFTPPHLRDHGYGKAVSAALGAHMLARGLKHCFILTDSHDPRTNRIYQAIGARTVAEFLRCTMRTRVEVPTGGRFALSQPAASVS
jgi:hypothetical protein